MSAQLTITNTVFTLVEAPDFSGPNGDNFTKVASVNPVAVNQVLSYTFTVKNTGNVVANNIVLFDTLPPNTVFIPGSVVVNGLPQISSDPVNGISIGSIAPNNSVIVTLKVKVISMPTNGTIVNQGRITFKYTTSTGSYTGGAISTISTVSVSGGFIVPPGPGGSLNNGIKTSDKQLVSPGDIITYTLTLFNQGNTTISNVSITDPIPVGTTFIPDTLKINNVIQTGVTPFAVNIPSIPAGKTVLVSYQTKADTIIPASISNIASLSYTVQPDPAKAPVTVTVPGNGTIVYNASNATSKTINNTVFRVGDTVVYTVSIVNTSPNTIVNATIRDEFPTSLGLNSVTVNGTTVSGNLTTGISLLSINPGASKIVKMYLTVLSAITIPFKNNAIVTLTYQTEAGNPQISQVVTIPDTGIAGGGSGPNYNGITSNNPQISMTKNSDRQYAAIGDEVTYTVVATNTGSVDAMAVIFKDILAPQLEFVQGSVTINGKNNISADILAGIVIDTLVIGQSITLKFKAKVVSGGVIPNVFVAEYMYSPGPGLPPKGATNKVQGNNVTALNIDLTVVKTANKTFAMLGDTISYTVSIANESQVNVASVLLRDTLPRYFELIQGTFKVNGIVINGVHLQSGVNIGTIMMGQTTIVTYDVKVISTNCSSQLVNIASVRYTYLLPDGTVGVKELKPTMDSTNIIDMGISNFKQLSIESYLDIPASKPDIEAINSTIGTIDIGECHVIETAKLTSIEGQTLTGYKLIIRGNLNLIVEYTSLTTSQAVHSAHYKVPFSNFIVLSEDFVVGSKIEALGIVEDVYTNQLNKRTFFSNTTALINVKILFC
ncbi:MAG: DUF7507 domain-containing protein [Clostridium sp.]